LQLIPGLGPKLAAAILDRRRELGGFQRIEQLADIPGIKQQRVQMLSRYLKITTEASSEASSGANASSNSNRLSDLEHE
jgi:transcriptional accessory protein Tex/SPT6